MEASEVDDPDAFQSSVDDTGFHRLLCDSLAELEAKLLKQYRRDVSCLATSGAAAAAARIPGATGATSFWSTGESALDRASVLSVVQAGVLDAGVLASEEEDGVLDAGVIAQESKEEDATLPRKEECKDALAVAHLPSCMSEATSEKIPKTLRWSGSLAGTSQAFASSSGTEDLANLGLAQVTLRTSSSAAEFAIDKVWASSDPPFKRDAEPDLSVNESSIAANAYGASVNVSEASEGPPRRRARVIAPQVSLTDAPLLGRWMLHPESRARLTWMSFGAVLLILDLILVPLRLAALLPEARMLAVLEWISCAFWSLDICVTFLIGYHKDGYTEMNPRRVADAYLRSWFLCDLSIVCLDLANLVSTWTEQGGESQASNGAVTAGRSLRILRLLRLFRLVRFRKLFEVTERWFDMLKSDLNLMVLKITQLVSMILVLNHYIACAFCAIGFFGKDSGDAGFSWMGDVELSHLENYISAYHWSLTQFTPSTQNIAPVNIFERFFATCVVLVALVTFSTFLGKMTSAMTQLLSLNAAKHHEEATLRRFFRENHVSRALTIRVWQCYRQQSGKHNLSLSMMDVSYFSRLPQSLQARLRAELYMKFLTKIPIFARLGFIDTAQLHAICNLFADVVGTPLQEVFTADTPAPDALCVMFGSMEYHSAHDHTQQEISCGDWVSEAALWGAWRRCGLLKARSSCRWVALHGDQFRLLLGQIASRLLWRILRSYAARFARAVNRGEIFTDVVEDGTNAFLRRELAGSAVQKEVKLFSELDD